MPNLSIEKYTGEWTIWHASHLLRRTLFGPNRQEILNAATNGLDVAVENLLNAIPPIPDDPVNYFYADDPNVPIGSSWINAEFTPGKEGPRRTSYNAWEIGNMINESGSLRTKMTLFWLNHFVTESKVVNDARAFYKYINIFRYKGLGNFRELVNEVTVSGAMLIYLNGNQNKNTAPNENYARELMELFSIGKGPQIGEGNYTNYTEDDIREAAKVLTGFTTVRKPYDDVIYKSNRHDKSTKTFSSAFGNHEIANNEENEYKDLINMILNQRETARFIMRKIYRWFLYYEITPEIEQNVIAPLADILYDNDYELKPVLNTFFSSKHFHDPYFHGCQIKSPVDFNIGLIRQLELTFPPKEDYFNLYTLWQKIFQKMSLQQQDIANPPDVSGWKAYYQQPQYYRMWVNAVTLPQRQEFVRVVLEERISPRGVPIGFDPFRIIDNLSKPDDPNALIDELCELFFPLPLSQAQLDDLKEALIPGLPDFEWTVEYGDYKANPGDPDTKKGVRNKLIKLFKAMLNMAEYQLC